MTFECKYFHPFCHLNKGLIWLCLTCVSLPLLSQDTAYEKIDKEWHLLNITFFYETEHEFVDHPYFQSLKARLAGDTNAEIEELEKAIAFTNDDSLRQVLTEKMYSRLLNTGKIREAKDVILKYDLNADTTDLVFKRPDFPETSFSMSQDVVALPFEQFYFKATVNGTDTVTVFFDTGAPGVAVSEELVERYGWETDTTYSGTSVLPALGMRFKNYPVLIPELNIGGLVINNLFAKYSMLTAEEEEILASKGLNKHDILIGLNVFRKLVDGVAFDYPNGEIRFIKNLPKASENPNFCFVKETPAITYQWKGQKLSAYLDTGSPRHVLPKSQLMEADADFNREASYGQFTYGIYNARFDRILNLTNVTMEAADYGFPVNPDFGIYTLFGSFKDHVLFFDLRNRRASLQWAK